MSLENKNNTSKDEMRDERDEYNEITREIKEEPSIPFNQKEHDSKSRYIITILFIFCYFLFLLLVLLWVLLLVIILKLGIKDRNLYDINF